MCADGGNFNEKWLQKSLKLTENEETPVKKTESRKCRESKKSKCKYLKEMNEMKMKVDLV